MSEPKGEQPTEVKKKSSKKSSKKKQPASTVVDVPPPMEESEPKPESSGVKQMKKSSKRRGSSSNDQANPTTTIDYSVGHGPDAQAADKDEIERQRRKEAKRIRAREKEERRKKQEAAEREEQNRIFLQKQAEELARLNANAEECQEENDEYGDDGFEDYDDDFEDDEDSPTKNKRNVKVVTHAKEKNKASLLHEENPEDVKNIAEALAVENAALKNRKKPQENVVKQKKKEMNTIVAGRFGTADCSDANKSSTHSSYKKSMSSSIAGLKHSLDPKARRVKEIQKLKEFSMEKFDQFGQTPLSKFDTYLHAMRANLVHQVFSQTNENNRSFSTQTEILEKSDKSMHFPDDVGWGFGSSKSDEKSSLIFSIFLQRSAQVCEILLEENLVEDDEVSYQRDSAERKKEMSFNTSNICIGEGCNKLLDSILQRRWHKGLSFSPHVSHLLLSAYSPSSSMDALLCRSSILCMWDLNQPECPTKWLAGEGIVSCCCLSPGKSHIAFAGTEEGSILIWDLRDRNIPISLEVLDATNVSLEVAQPTYFTSGNQQSMTAHVSSVCSISCVYQSVDVLRNTGISYQLASLDDRGTLTIWNIVELEETDENDYCLQFGGLVKLVKGTTINVFEKIRTMSDSSVGPKTCTMQFFPNDPSQYIVGTNGGKIIRGCRFGKLHFPKVYCSPLCDGAVESISFSTFLPKYFLAGYSNGAISLFNKDISSPLMVWNECEVGVSICSINWSTSRPGVFYAVDSSGSIRIWDFLQSVHVPELSQTLKELAMDDLCSENYTFTLSSEHIKTRAPSVALCNKSGTLLVYELAQGLVKKEKNELNEVEDILNNFVW